MRVVASAGVGAAVLFLEEPPVAVIGDAVPAVRKMASVLARLAKATEGDRSSGARLAIGRTLERLTTESVPSATAVALVAGGQCHVAHAGPVRVAVYREGRLRTLAGDRDAAVLCADLADRDWLVLLSEPIVRVLDDDTIAECLRGSAEEAAQSLVVAAQAMGAAREPPVVVLRIAAEGRPERVDAIARVLAGTMLFRGLTDAERLVVAPYLDHRRLGPGDVLFEEGDPGDAFYVVVDGRVRITRGGTPLTEVGAGGSFGELCLARRVPRSGSVVALEDTLVLGLTRDRFHEVVEHRPEIGAKLLLDAVDALGDRLRDLTERLAKVERLAVGEEKPADLALRTAIILAARGEEG